MRFSGIVQKGDAQGAALGFPTANIPFTDDVSGIFAATVFLDGKKYPAATYVDVHRGLLEAHLLDFEGDLYGKEIGVELLEKIREDKAFADQDEARRQIAEDVQKVREYFRVR